MTLARGYWKQDLPLKGDSAAKDFSPPTSTQVDSLEEAVLIGSLLPSGKHAPVIDIDLPCQLVESSTAGHFHLYIEKAVSWDQYKKILRALTEAGIVEEGYESASIARGQTFVRKPGLKKASS